MKTESSTRRVVHALSVLVLLTAAGCVQTSFVALSSASYAPKPEGCDLEVFNTTLPDRDYEEIGIIEGKGSMWKSDLADILPKLRERACEVGGDAIILGDSDSYSQGDDGYDVQKTSATVIRWR